MRKLMFAKAQPVESGILNRENTTDQLAERKRIFHMLQLGKNSHGLRYMFLFCVTFSWKRVVFIHLPALALLSIFSLVFLCALKRLYPYT
jgi:hypothetical protein